MGNCATAPREIRVKEWSDAPYRLRVSLAPNQKQKRHSFGRARASRRVVDELPEAPYRSDAAEQNLKHSRDQCFRNALVIQPWDESTHKSSRDTTVSRDSESKPPTNSPASVVSGGSRGGDIGLDEHYGFHDIDEVHM